MSPYNGLPSSQARRRRGSKILPTRRWVNFRRRNHAMEPTSGGFVQIQAFIEDKTVGSPTLVEKGGVMEMILL
jgi:hypothetical protein